MDAAHARAGIVCFDKKTQQLMYNVKKGSATTVFTIQINVINLFFSLLNIYLKKNDVQICDIKLFV